ncbi:hypothetical protein ACJJTC_015261, partial [Scirpophaga incertulas]
TELKTQGCPREISITPSQQDAQDDSNVATQRTLTPTIHLPPAHSLIRPVLPAYRDIVIGQPSQCMTQRKSEFDTVSILSDLDDGFKTVMSRKKRIANMRGTMVNCNRLRVAESTTHIYVSRFSKDVSEEDVKNHISDMGEECRGITLLKQNRETSFNSFKGSHHPLGRSRLLSLTHRACYRLGPLHRRTWHAWCVLCVAENRPATTD